MNIKLPMFGRSKPATAPTVPPAVQASFQTSRSREYTTGHPDVEVAASAGGAAQVGLHNPDISGENTYPFALDQLTKGHDVAAEVIGHGARDDTQNLVDVIEANAPLVNTAEGNALSAVDAAGSAEKKQIALRHRILSAGLPLPTRKGFLVFCGAEGALFTGDWGFNAIGFQGFGLSDKPWIPGLGFTDDLHLASLTAVAALVFLADGAGHKLRRIAHDIHIRRQTAKERRKDVSWPSGLDIAVFVVCILGAFYAVQGLSAIRADYLHSQGTPANTSAFVAIQVGVLLAAIYLSYWHANPMAKEWNSQVIETTKAKATEKTIVGEHDRIVGIYNALIERVLTVFALAGHHVRADSANVAAQHALYRDTYLRAQSEPAQSKVFTDGIAEPAVYEDDELYQKLIGVTLLPTFTKATTDKVIERKATIRDEICELLARIDNTEISKLNLIDVTGERDETDGDSDSTSVTSSPTKPTPVSPLGASDEQDVVDADVIDDEAAA